MRPEAPALLGTLEPGAPAGVAVHDESLRELLRSPSLAGVEVDDGAREALAAGRPVRGVELTGGGRAWVADWYPLERDGRRLAACVAVDVTEHDAAEARLRASRERLDRAQDLALLGSFRWDAQRGTWTWSEQLCRLAGLDPAAGTPDWEAWLAPESREALRAAVRDGRPFDLLLRQRRPDASQRIVRAHGGPAAGGLEGFAQDVTELKRAEDHQRAVAALGQAALSGLPLDELMERATEIVAATLELDHVSVLEVVPGGDRLLLRAGLGRPPHRIGAREEVVIGDPAEPYGLLVAHSPRPDALGGEHVAFLRAVANVLDSAVARLRAEREVAEHAAARGRLVAQALDAEDRTRREISELLHDGPLQDLLALNRELLRLEVPGEHLGRARAGVARAIAGLRELMVDLHPVLLEAAGLESALGAVADQQARHGGFECELRIDPAAGGLRDDLVIALARELLTNAAKHADARRVRVEVRRTAEELLLEVADDGAGIPTGRLPSALREGHIGLASSIQRVEAVGGTLTLSPAPGGGTSAAVRLPV